MSDLDIKSSPIKDSAPQGSNGRSGVTALAGLAGTFQDLVSKVGFRLEDGFSALAQRTGISAVVERPEPANRANDYGRDNADDARDRFDNGVRSNDTGEDRSDSNRVDRNDDYGRDAGAENRDDRSDDAGRENGDSQASRDDGNEEQPDDNQASSDDNQDDNGDEQSADAGGEDDAAGNENNDENGTAGSEETTETADGSSVSTEAANAALAGLIAGGDALSADGKASEQGKVSSADGIARATSNISNAGPDKAAAQGTANMAQAAVENTSKTTPSSSGQGKDGQDNHEGQGQANTGDQAKGIADEVAAIIAGTDGEEETNTIGAQAAGLAKAIGDGNKAQVTVTVNNEAQNLTSKPIQTLSANSVLSTASNAQQSNGQNTDTHAQGNGQNQAALVQDQNAQRAQAAASTFKGLAQASSVSSGSGTTHTSGGGEGPAQVGGSSATQQTQSQSAANQTSSTQKTFRPGHSVAEQITVKITKAIQSGSDKIVIQLRPANMGRVEVKIELSQDNRLTAVIIADNKDTLDQLKNDARSLQRALEDAGIQTDAGDLKFNLRGQEGQDQDNKGSSAKLSFDDEELAVLEAEIIDQPVIAADGTIISNGRVDVRA